MKNLFVLFNVFLIPSAFAADMSGQWQVTKGELKYTADHPMKTSSGISTEVKGKSSCDSKKCEFLIAAPVKSFDSKSSNRDLHMQQVTRAAEHPLVVLRAKCPNQMTEGKLVCDLQIDFAGKQQSYSQQKISIVPSSSTGEMHAKGTFTISLKAFSIEAPSLLSVSIKDNVPIEYDVVFAKSQTR